MSEYLKDYLYDLPEELIAQVPANPRDSSRLLVVHRKTGRLEHRFFTDVVEYLDQDDLLVVNNTKVLRARLLGHRIRPDGAQGGKVEFVMLEELAPRVWEGLFHASAKYLPGFEFLVPTPDGKGLRGRLVKGSAESVTGNVVAEFDRDPTESGAGELPLPRYIDRKTSNGPTSEDENRYQTVYAKELGSAAAPTAGLHFTDSVIEKLRAKHVEWAEVTLHVGVGTFRSVKTPDLASHLMHEEKYQIAPEIAQRITEAKRSGKRIVAVGTTSVRTLESASLATGDPSSIQSGIYRTQLFIRPGHHEFKVIDRLITNFHLPGSTLLMLVSTFAGRELILKAYDVAVRERYRFFSYGDAMLII
jgi:S-adenosylmethionine:tRNA ribosyltransferase-isomerase